MDVNFYLPIGRAADSSGAHTWELARRHVERACTVRSNLLRNSLVTRTAHLDCTPDAYSHLLLQARTTARQHRTPVVWSLGRPSLATVLSINWCVAITGTVTSRHMLIPRPSCPAASYHGCEPLCSINVWRIELMQHSLLVSAPDPTGHC